MERHVTIGTAGRRTGGRAESWAFEAICLARPQLDCPAPHRIVISVEPDLLGFAVQQRILEPPPQRGAPARRSYTLTLADAIVLAGQLAHDRLRQGFVLETRPGAPWSH